MIGEERRKIITDLIRQEQTVSVSDLIEMFSVSNITIRRDLDQLEQQGNRKVYGGAVLAEGPSADFQNTSMSARRSRYTLEKLAIAQTAAQLIASEDVIILDAGTTMLELSKCLPKDPGLVIITNSLAIAQELAEQPVTLLLTGGQVRGSTYSTIGPKTKNFLSDLRANKVFLASALSIEEGLMNSKLYESEIKQQMMKSADKVILLADHSKFRSKSYHTFANWDDIDIVVTYGAVPDDVVSSLRVLGVEVIVSSVAVRPAGTSQEGSAHDNTEQEGEENAS